MYSKDPLSWETIPPKFPTTRLSVNFLFFLMLEECVNFACKFTPPLHFSISSQFEIPRNNPDDDNVQLLFINYFPVVHNRWTP